MSPKKIPTSMQAPLAKPCHQSTVKIQSVQNKTNPQTSITAPTPT